jgi:hypothetical protein
MHLAHCASFNILCNVVVHAWPPIVLGDILCSLCNSGVSCSNMVVKKGNHPPLKVIVSHNNKRGALPPEVARPMFNAMGSMPGIQLYLVFLETLGMQYLSLDVGIDVIIINVSDPKWGFYVHVWNIGVVVTHRVVKGQGLDMGWFRQLCLQINCRHIWGYKEVFWEGNDRFVVVRVGGIVWTSREGISSVRGTRLVDELDVVLLMFSDIASNTGSDFVRMSVELEVRMVSNDEDRVCCTFK